MEEDLWEDIPLTSLTSPRQGVIVPFMDPKSPIPRGVQQSSMGKEQQRIKQPRKLEFFEQEDFRARGALYPQLSLVARNAPPHEWSSRAETKEVCHSALSKLERNADVEQYTTPERNALKKIIQMKESAGGFGLLMDGDRYQSVASSLAYYARIGLI